jgi:glutamyl-tRNA synthetase
MPASPNTVTRFAPSPTGYLHIGGARTALFNWLYAKRMGGTFLLRIEDTDRARSTEAAIDAILDGLKWLGLDWDGAPVYQFSRAARHAEVAHQMLAAGHAYRCYSQPAEIEAAREAIRAENKARKAQGRSDFVPELFQSPWRDRAEEDRLADKPFAVRLKAPRTGETVIEDHVQGRVVFQNENLDDMVLLRSDGTPTYMLAVVVDDHDMGVTHIIRGDDHLTNAARQSQIYTAMGWDIPAFAHIPLIHGPDGAKLSKRHGALGVDAYRAMGYLPEAMRNYLARLGWAHGDDEIFSTEQAIAWFGLEGIGRSPSRFDFAKLENLNGHYIRAAADRELVRQIRAILPEVDSARDLVGKIGEDGWRKLEQAMPGLKERAKTLVELIDQARYLFAIRPLQIDEKAAKLLTPDARAHLAALHPRLAAVEIWEPAALEDAVRVYAEETGTKLGSIAQPLRAALTGRTTSPGIFDVLHVLGRTESLARIADQAEPPGEPEPALRERSAEARG